MPTLSTSRYVPPGSYLGPIISPDVTELSGRPRIPCFVGRGSRYGRARNIGIRRSFVYAEDLTFPPVAPYRATLAYNSDRDIQTATIYRSDGSELPRTQWSYFSANQVDITIQAFDPTETYTIDYQSTSRDVLDPVPIDDIRNNIKIGRIPDQDQFTEYVDYLIDMTVTGDPVDTDALLADPTNTYTVTDVCDMAGALGDMTAVLQAPPSARDLVFSVGNAYSHDYNRYYFLEVMAFGGVEPNRTVDIRWYSTPSCPGNNNLPSTPIDISDLLERGTFTLTEDGAAGPPYISNAQILEYGLEIQATWETALDAFAVGDTFEFNALGAGLMEFDLRHLNANQFLDIGAVAPVPPANTTITVTGNTFDVGDPGNRQFRLECTASGGGVGTRTADFMWGAFLEGSYTSGSFSIDEALPLTLVRTIGAPGPTIELTFGYDPILAGNFADGEIYNILVKPPRIEVEFKDDRSYEFRVTSVGANDVNFIWSTDTREGQSGTGDANNNGYVNTTGSTSGLPGNFRVRCRNIDTLLLAPATRYATGDLFDCDWACDDTIDWRLQRRSSETFTSNDDIYDAIGAVTGTPMTYYIVLSETPTSIISVTQAGTPISYNQVAATPYVWFNTPLTADTIVTYEWRSLEPAPGALYYLTANYLRPDSMYNVATRFTSYASARAWLLPVEPDNDLLVQLDIIEQLFSGGLRAIYLVQVQDADDDGIYTDVDFEAGIDATEEKNDIRDVIVLNHWTTLAYLLTSINNMNDPFTKKERMTWLGAPVDTPIGDASTPNTLVYYAKNTLQVYGDSSAHGTRILVAPTYCKKTIQMEDGTTLQLTLDGSFVAGYLAAQTCAFSIPSNTLLRRTIGSFDEIETYNDSDNLQVGAAYLVYMQDKGSSVYWIEQATTVDTFAPNFLHISAMVQKQYVTAEVRDYVDQNIIGLVPSSSETGAALVKGVLVSILRLLLSRGIIASYEDEDKNEREINVNTDVIAWRDQSSPTLYHYNFAYWLLYPIERVFGLYMVDSNQFGRA